MIMESRYYAAALVACCLAGAKFGRDAPRASHHACTRVSSSRRRPFFLSLPLCLASAPWGADNL